MFAVIYQWRVIPGLEAQFEEGWRRGTEAIAREFGGWGSRLHRGEGNTYVAYAQWPDEESWRRALETRMVHSDDRARQMYRDAIEPGSFETVFALPVVSDLLELRRA
jgi:heme-degrading monooxygenase HmoA